MQSKTSWAELCFALIVCLTASCDSKRADSNYQIIAFGTRVELSVFGGDADRIRTVIARVESRYQDIDRDWYPWERDTVSRPGELRRINAALASGLTIEVSPPLARLIRRAAIIETRSLGRFNPGIARLSELWGFDNVLRENWAPPSAAAVKLIIDATPGSQNLQWNENTLSSRSAVTQIDLGGIAKGAILGITAALLRDGGLENAIINIGGDLSVIGNIHGRPARIGIRSPVAAEPIGWLEISGGETVVTSGDYERFFEHEGEKYPHILDPESGYPVRHTASVTVIHRDPILADAAATALVVAGMAEFDQTCAALGITQAILIDSSGELRLTADMDARVNWLR